jgi:antitoxin (DNA-binding transcriptional repressor) of toxin-antitoxin stability system
MQGAEGKKELSGIGNLYFWLYLGVFICREEPVATLVPIQRRDGASVCLAVFLGVALLSIPKRYCACRNRQEIRGVGTFPRIIDSQPTVPPADG